MNTKALTPRLSTFFDDFITRDFPTQSWFENSKLQSHLPSVNISENQKEFAIELAAPGLEKNDFQIELNKNILTVSSKVQKEKSETKNDFVRREFNFSSFSRSFQLPKNSINIDEINAEYKSGILTINVPKLEKQEIKQPKQIAVK